MRDIVAHLQEKQMSRDATEAPPFREDELPVFAGQVPLRHWWAMHIVTSLILMRGATTPDREAVIVEAFRLADLAIRIGQCPPSSGATNAGPTEINEIDLAADFPPEHGGEAGGA